MPVKPNQSVETAMRVLEAVADEQPAGVSALARLLDLDKNATQRALVSLGHAGWIRQAADDPGAWELTSRSLKVGHRFAPTLVQRARPRLEALHEATGETVVMMAREGDRMVAVDSVESSQPLRLSVPIGMDVPLQRSGAVDAFLPADEHAPRWSCRRRAMNRARQLCSRSGGPGTTCSTRSTRARSPSGRRCSTPADEWWPASSSSPPAAASPARTAAESAN